MLSPNPLTILSRSSITEQRLRFPQVVHDSWASQAFKRPLAFSRKDLTNSERDKRHLFQQDDLEVDQHYGIPQRAGHQALLDPNRA